MKARALGLASGLVVAAALGCGGAKKGAEDASSGDSEAKQGTPWKDKSREQRMDWMGLAVFPKMRAIFQEHDAKYAKLNCQTCHGDDMEMVDFKMPNYLFSLPKANTLEWAKDYDAKTTEFMSEQVVPEMAKLLDMPAYDADTGKGFGCFGCHPAEAD
jgi:hypothetical protein